MATKTATNPTSPSRYNSTLTPPPTPSAARASNSRRWNSGVLVKPSKLTV
jgi:hypothetical protein